MNKRIIWIIDENKNQLKTSMNAFKIMMPSSVEIETVFPPHRMKEEYIDSILANPNTACIIIDQKLKDTGITTYVGIELAQYLRGINTKIPIYILTNYVDEKDEFVGGEWSVEDILDKGMLSDERAAIIRARILRNIDVYEDMLDERTRRFNALLKKSLTEQLDDTEQKELETLQFERTSVTLASEFQQLTALEQIVNQHRALLEDFKESLIDEDHDGE